MNIVIVTAQVPLTRGGAELHAEMLEKELMKRGHKAEQVRIPFKWYPTETLLDGMMMGRQMDLTEADGKKIDMVIPIKFPAFYTKHPNKVLWLEHQFRDAYDFVGTQFESKIYGEDTERVRKLIHDCDCEYIAEAKKVFTIAQNTSKRLLKYNGIESEVLYHPPLNYEKLQCSEYGDYVFYPSRINIVKRQRLLAEAALYTKSNVKIVIAGTGADAEMAYIKELIENNHLEDKVILTGFISEEEKLKYYGGCLAVYFGAYDEDYGYITLEGMYAEKPVIVHHDAGGPLEFVEDGRNGFIIDPDPKVIAEKLDLLYEDRKLAEKLGSNGRLTMQEKNVNWDYCIDKLLGVR